MWFPDTLQTTLRYQETLSLSSTSGSLFGYIYNLNGLYDPNHTGVGHQPLYFDQLTDHLQSLHRNWCQDHS